MPRPREDRKLIPIDQPGPKVMIMEPPPGERAFHDGPGLLDWHCPYCDFVLGEGLEEGMVRGIVVKCSKCGKYSCWPW
jgi:hypothetical protein